MSIEKQKLFNEIETLPDELTNQVIDFIEYLKLSYVDAEAPENVTIKSKKVYINRQKSIYHKIKKFFIL